jgi:gluconate 5-dehydrogenase
MTALAAPGQFRDMFSLAGKVALVSGGAGGLGREIASALADFGARVAIADLHLDRAREVAAACARDGHAPLAYALDVTDAAQAEAVVAALVAETGRIDILVNAAGINVRKPAIDYAPAEWQRIVDTNLGGVFFLTQAAGKRMLAAGSGRVLSIGSVSSLLGHPNHAPYAASKGGIAILTKALATEWAPHGVTVNAIGPAYTETDLTAAHLATPGTREKIVKTIPMGRLGRPDDLVGAAVFLCSDAASFVTGQTLYVDGGRTAD